MTLGALHSSSCTTVLPAIASVIGPEAVVERREEPAIGEIRRAPRWDPGSDFLWSRLPPIPRVGRIRSGLDGEKRGTYPHNYYDDESVRIS